MLLPGRSFNCLYRTFIEKNTLLAAICSFRQLTGSAFPQPARVQAGPSRTVRSAREGLADLVRRSIEVVKEAHAVLAPDAGAGTVR